jgi:hypothetical protein
MRLSHSISMTLLVSLSGCSDEASAPGDTSAGGMATGGTATGGTATGGTATGGTATGGTATGGAGGMATGGTAGGGAADHPTDQTQAGIEAYLMMELYKGAGWRPEAMPGEDTSQPHLATNRFFNETIIASKAAGNRPPSMGQHTVGSMSVKELLTGTTVIGKAATLRSDANMWIFYCKASEAGRCGTNTMPDVPVYTTQATQSCACHGSGTNTSHDAIPAP